MQEQFVPYEITQILIEKGFKEQCLAYYQNQTLIINALSNYELDKYKLGIPAPLWQQVIDWLREKHSLDIMTRQLQLDGRAYYKITKIETEDKIKGYSNFCKSPYEAREKAIKQALTLI